MRAIVLWVSLLAAQDLAEQSLHGKQAMAEHRYAEAAAIYQNMADALPDNAGLRLNLGLALFSLGEYSESIPALEKSTQLEPKLQPAWLLLGLCYQKQHDPAHAITPLRQAVTLNPADKTARFELADAYFSTRQTKLASEQFEAAARLDPKNAKALLGLGITYLELYADALHGAHLAAQKRWAEAFMLYRGALADSPSLPGAHAGLAKVYRETGHSKWAAVEGALEKRPHPSYSDQVEDVEKRLRQLGDRTELHEFLARLSETVGSRAEAAQEWKQAARLAPEDRRIQGPLARALWRNREYDEARPVLEQLARDEPRAAEWNYLLGDLLYREQQSDAALTYLMASVRMDPGNLAARAVLGRVYMQLGRMEEAIPQIEAAIDSDEDGSLHYQLGLAYRRLGRADEARVMFDRQRALASRVATVPEIAPPLGGR
jgi:tetratricopeptide (TPR) repeat protein